MTHQQLRRRAPTPALHHAMLCAALLLQHPPANTRDTAVFRPYQREVGDGARPRPRKLSKLCLELLAREIQTGIHSPDEDAVAALHLYRITRRAWERALRTGTVGALPVGHAAPLLDAAEVKRVNAQWEARADEAAAAATEAAAAAASGASGGGTANQTAEHGADSRTHTSSSKRSKSAKRSHKRPRTSEGGAGGADLSNTVLSAALSWGAPPPSAAATPLKSVQGGANSAAAQLRNMFSPLAVPSSAAAGGGGMWGAKTAADRAKADKKAKKKAKKAKKLKKAKKDAAASSDIEV